MDVTFLTCAFVSIGVHQWICKMQLGGQRAGHEAAAPERR
jgi:hypothetical protein